MDYLFFYYAFVKPITVASYSLFLCDSFGDGEEPFVQSNQLELVRILVPILIYLGLLKFKFLVPYPLS